MYKIAVKDIASLFQAIAKEQTLYLPVEKPGQVDYDEYKKGVKVKLDTLNTAKSPKGYFFPQSDTIINFDRGRTKIEIEPVKPLEDDFVIFGVRACDVRGMEILDRVFLSDPVDTFYEARRKHGTIVSLACREPEESCFCNVFGIDSAEPGADVTTWIAGGELFWKANTDKGEKLTKTLEKVLTKADKKDEKTVEDAKKDLRAIMDQLPLKDLKLDRFKEENLQDIFDDERWKELYVSCLGCGTCTFVCPTCQCYDIKDFNTGHGIQRYRCWDSCMYSEFTQCAASNPRTTQMERFRQRFMHKLVYYPANNDGLYMCVGCGRCVQKCPVSMNIAKVIKSLGGEAK